MTDAGPLVVSCEHATCAIPKRWQAVYREARDVLRGHEGWDVGAAGLARRLGRRFGAPVHLGGVGRLLVDLNRSPGHPRLFSSFTRGLAAEDRDEILARWYRPYREAVMRDLDTRVRGGGRVIHLSVHSFTPVLDGRERRFDIGLLYDPGRAAERALAERWQAALRRAGLVVRRNQPYRGASDGFTSWLRRRLTGDTYLGLELEANQRLCTRNRFPADIADRLAETLAPLLD